MTQEVWPATVEQALSEGYFEISAEEEKKEKSGVAGAPPVCLTSPQGTICHSVVRSNGDRVVGYCNGAGQCILYVKPARPNDHD